MVLIKKHEIFIVEVYYQNGTKVDGTEEYSVAACVEEFCEQFPAVAVEYKKF